MTSQQFSEYLALYGADLGQWPSELRAEAMQAMAVSDELKVLQQEEESFEQTLRMETVPEPSQDLAARIIARAKPRDSGSKRSTIADFLGSLLMPKRIAVIATIFILGVALGWYNPSQQQESQQETGQLGDIYYYEESSL